MSNGFKPGQFFWRASAAVLRHTGAALSKASGAAYDRSLPRLTAEERKIIRQNEILRDCHPGERCFIIGNGPSLNSQDLKFLSNETAFVMNAFWKHPIVERWQPRYYCFSDPLFFNQSRQSKQFFVDLRARIKTSHFFAPLCYKSVIETQNLLPPETTSYVALGNHSLGDEPGDPLDLTKEIPYVQTIPQLAILIAIFMGFKEVYLLGLDHDWLARLKGSGGFNFFEGLSIDHADAISEPVPYESEMKSMLKVWRGYHALNARAMERGTRIYNATHGGFLDVFERVSYESIFDDAVEIAR
jgi:hypothetical protein